MNATTEEVLAAILNEIKSLDPPDDDTSVQSGWWMGTVDAAGIVEFYLERERRKGVED